MKPDEKSLLGDGLKTLGIVLCIALVHGLVYLFLVPPWQHYDEPNHFERVWLTAQLGRSPSEEDYNPVMSREVVESMVANNFYANLDYLPDLSPGKDIKIQGFDQYSEKPLYYWLASKPVNWMHARSIDTQLIAARWISFLLYLITIIAAWGSAREIVPSGHTLRWMLPFAVAMLPGFADLMTAVNNDSLAVATASLFVWGALRLLRRGFSIFDFIWCTLCAVLIYYSKNTAYPLLLFFPFIVLFTFLHGKWEKIAWAMLAAGLVIILAYSLRFDDPALWYRATDQPDLRYASDQSVVGNFTLRIDNSEPATPRWLFPTFQPLPIDVARQLTDRPLTFGLWMWADRAVTAEIPRVNTTSQSIIQKVELGETPRFFAAHMTLTGDTTRIWVSLDPNPVKEKQVQVFFDGLVLAEGSRPLDQVPLFALADGSRGDWGGETFINLLRNPSFEKQGIGLNLVLDNWLTRYLPDNTRPSLILASLLDWRASGWLYKGSAMNILNTFWGKFGWGHVPFPWEGLYKLLTWVSLLCIGGAVIGQIIRLRRALFVMPLFLAGAFLLTFLSTMTRGAVYLAWGHLFIPGARYFYPAIIPTMVILCLGWLEIVRLSFTIWEKIAKRLVRKSSNLDIWKSRTSSVGFLVFFLSLAIYAIYSVATYYAIL